MKGYIKIPTPDDLDIISDIKFSPVENHLLVSSWDNQILLYDTNHHETCKLMNKFQSTTPTLCMVFARNNNAYVGTLEGGIFEIDFENDKLLNTNWIHFNDLDSGINNINTIDNLIISTSFDKKFQGTDYRQSKAVFSNSLPHKILKMDANDNEVVLALSDRIIERFDKRDWSKPIETRESPFDLQINDLKMFDEGFAVSSIDGRVGMEFFSPDTSRFVFRCHRTTDKLTNTQIAYPVNALSFNNNLLYTSGSDGIVNIWNWQNKKKTSSLNQLKYSNNEIQSIVKSDINYTKNLLAIATSDDGYKTTKDLNYTSSLPQYPSNVYLYCL